LGSPYSTAGRGEEISNLNSFPKPLSRRILTPRNAPNDIFRRLENKLKASKLTKNNTNLRESRKVSYSLLTEGKLSPEIRIKNHIRTLLASMRALRDVPSDYFK